MLNELIDRVGGIRRVLAAVVGLGAAALILVGSRMATAPVWVPALTDVPLESAAGLADRLSQAGITYQLDRGGSEILVAEADLARARVTLAKDGLPGGSRPGLELFDRPTWGWNDFTQRVNYRRALEGELERTIGRMSGIERAEVHLAISDESAFRRAGEKPATASVLLALKAGGTPQPEVVQGIAQLVSSSVDGLASENVSIHDETGKQWSEPADDRSVAGVTGKQLRVQQEVEKHLEQKAEALVAQMVGPNNARVQVAASMNFDKVERTTQTVDPEKQALSSEQKAEITPGAAGGAGSSNVTNSYENTKSTETFSSAIGSIKRLTVAVLVNESRVPSEGPADSVPRFQPRPAAELAMIESLVRSAVGLDSTRGDAVSVVSLPFETPKVAVAEAPPKPTLISQVQAYQRPVLTSVGLVFAFVLAVMALGSLRRGASQVAAALPAAGLSAGALSAGVAQPVLARQASKLNLRPADTEVRDRVVETVQQNPEAAARLMKTWIKAT